MTSDRLALELKNLAWMSVIHPLLGRPATRLEWLFARVNALLPGVEFGTDTADRVFQAMLLGDTELGAQ